MKKLSKYEILNSVVVISILALLVVFSRFLSDGVFIVAYVIVAFKFLLPGTSTYLRFLDIDFSKLLNTILWTLIVSMIFYIDNYIHPFFAFGKGAGIVLISFYLFFMMVRGVFYLWYKQEPIFKYYFWQTDEFIKIRNRNLTPQDAEFTNVLRIGYIIIFIVILNFYLDF